MNILKFNQMDQCIDQKTRVPINASVKHKINIPGSINLPVYNYQNHPNDTAKNQIKKLIVKWMNERDGIKYSFQVAWYGGMEPGAGIGKQ